MRRAKTSRTPLSRRLAAAVLVALSALAAPPPAAAEVYWVGGYELDISLEPTRPSFVLGEPVYVSLRVENRSRTDLELLWSGERGPGWPDDFEVRVAGPDGKPLPPPPAEEAAPDTPYSNGRVRAPDDRENVLPVTRILLRLDRWARIDKPGRYTVTCRRGLRAGPYGTRYRLFPGTTEPAVEVRAQTEVNVVEGGAERVGRLVDELGARMLECDKSPHPADSVEAAMRLAEIDDERVVGYFRQALGRCKAGSIKSAALRAFAKFETDAAFEGLRLAAADADDDLRTLAALELSRSKSPKARPLLLSMRADPFHGVRLMVLNALEAWDTQRARRLIWEMTNDEHPMVRAEALRFLQERSAHPPRR